MNDEDRRILENREHEDVIESDGTALADAASRVAELEWLHRYEILPNLWSGGLDDTDRKLAPIPADLRGRRVLDVGCCDGAMSFTCEQRGAEVLAVDVHRLQTFDLAHQLRESRVRFETRNVYELDNEEFGTFDLVLFMGVLYHLRHPLHAIDRLYDMLVPGGSLLVESHCGDGGASTVTFFPDNRLNGDDSNWWAPSPPALIAMFESSGFELTGHEQNAPTRWCFAFRRGERRPGQYFANELLP